MSTDAQEAEKQLEQEKRVLSALFEEELTSQGFLTENSKKEIALVSEVPLDKVKEVFRKAGSYKKMHRFLRYLSQTGQPLPETMSELQYDFKHSRFQSSARERRFARAKQEKGEGYMRAARLRYIKFKKN